jgi:hypothetical protein
VTARVWTKAELDGTHGLPTKAWSWAFDEQVGWHVRGPLNTTICIDHCGDVVALAGGTDRFDPPADVALAVILASKGLDSMEAMARATVFESVRAAIDRQSKKAKAEVARLTAMVKFNATGLTEEDNSIGIPACHAWRITEEQIALQAAHAQLAAVRQVWLAVSCEVDNGAKGTVKA